MDIKKKLQNYIDNNINATFVSFKKARYAVERDCCISSARLEDVEYGEANLDNYINNNKDDNKFQKLLFKYIDDKNLKDSDVYNKVGIDRRLFSKIRSDKDYHPSKETVILLAIALELSEDELEDLLLSAAYSLPMNNHYDLIIRFCFKENIYDLFTINEYLSDYSCKPLSC